MANYRRLQYDDLARAGAHRAGGRRPDPAALLPPLARRADRDEGVHGAPELLDRRGLLPRLLRAAHDLLALFWAIMGCIWVYDLAVGHASLQRTGNHKAFAALLFAMPLVYPLFSLLLGRTFPMITSPVMPCSVAVFTIGLMLAFSERVNIVLAMFLCHWALIGFTKTYFFHIPEDFLLASSAVPGLYLFFKEYTASHLHTSTLFRARMINLALIIACGAIGVLFMISMVCELAQEQALSK